MPDLTLSAALSHTAVEDLNQLRDRIVTCLGKLTDDQIWARAASNENAIGNLVLHLCGNVRQWIGFGLGGKPDIRVRDREFQAQGGATRQELAERISAVVDDAVAVISSLDEAALLRPTTVQGYNVTGVAVLVHVVQHFGQHTGQIILLTKHATGEDLGFYAHLSNPTHAEKTP
ncbi:MAG: DinB family protein [Bryobacteraceae bacterium]